MSKPNRLNISLTIKELSITMEAVGLYKSILKSKAAKMANKHGVNNKGRSHQRLTSATSAQRKFSVVVHDKRSA